MSGVGVASYVFEDVVFTDTASPGAQVPTTVTLGFTAALEMIAGADTSSGLLRIAVRLIDDTGPDATWTSSNFEPNGGVGAPIVTGSLNVTTGKTYTLEIDANFLGSANQGSYAFVDGWTTWNNPPFGLSPGITADSPQAGIVDNLRTFAAPSIYPKVSADSPLTAGAPHNLYFTNGQPGSVGAYLVGGLPTGSGIQVGTWALLGILPSPLVLVPLTADIDGVNILPFTTAPGLSGSSLGLQAFQLYMGPPDEWHSTNTYVLNFQ